MGLSRLDNFLKSARGTILYVNPNDLDATDSIENRGNSLTRPFKTIQRALIESARFSYQKGLDNDRFGKTTILLYPGDHTVDNRPGYIPDGANNYRLRNGQTTNALPPFDLTSNFDLDSSDNELYKLNSVYGGVIIPRGTSLVGLDLRKTKIRPKYVPNPANDNIGRSALFRVTGGCYFWQFSMFDANPNGKCYVDYTANEFVPNFSHHKLTTFEYADGVNGVNINDTFMTFSTSRTDLDMYYEKVSLVYGQSSGRAIEPDYPSSGLDIQPKIDEYRIVGSTGKSVGISSIWSGDGSTATTAITAVLSDSTFTGLDVDTPFRVEGVPASGYDGKFVVAERPSDDRVVYNIQNSPGVVHPAVTGATLTLSSDTVTSSSPYIFNVSLRSVYGMCGLFADGKKATGFKSMVVAQFTGIGLQKDDNAFVVYNNDSPATGQYDDSTQPGNENLSTNSKAIYKPSYRNYHIKCSNDAVLQIVSVFAIGYAEHFLAESGGDQSITNSNSNFGASALNAVGFKDNAFKQDDKGYITHIIPPKEIPLTESSVEFESIDVNVTGSAVGVGSTSHLYLYGQTNEDVPPENVIEGYRVGAKPNDTLKFVSSTDGVPSEYSARIVMPGSDSSYEKSFTVNRSATGINSIGQFSAGGFQNVITLTADHDFLTGESVRVISDSGQLPDGINPNSIYYTIIEGLTENTNIKLAKTLNDAIDGTALDINDKGGVLTVVSRVSDKNSGDIGHPIQWDPTQSQWYTKVSDTDNTIYDRIVGLGSTALGSATPRTFITRKSDTRNALDTIYRARYVIPASLGGGVAKPPSDGFIVQESNTSIGATDGEIQTYFGTGSLTNENQQRNFRFISDVTQNGFDVTVKTELPHDLSVGSQVELVNVRSTSNATGVGNSGFNESYTVNSISDSKTFSVGLTTAAGLFTNNTSGRNTDLPYFKRKAYENTYFVYRHQESQPYVTGEQDGVYYLTLLNASNRPTVAPFTKENFSQPVKELYPQVSRDNPVADPEETKSFARADLIGDVVVSDVQKSVTKETLNKFVSDSNIGIGITNIQSATGTAHTITTVIDHGLNRITGISTVTSGQGYGDGSGAGGSYYNAQLVAIGSSVTGKNATAKINVDANGSITSLKIMDGGSAYGIGNTLAITGVAVTTGHEQAVIRVESVYDNVGDVIRVAGVSSEKYSGYNDLYKITDVATGAATSVTVESANPVANFSTTGVGAVLASDAYVYETGEALQVQYFDYNNTTGVGIVTTVNNHGLKVDHQVRLVGFTNDAVKFNGSFVITENKSLTSFAVNIGVGTAAAVTGSPFVYREGYAANQGVITPDNENLNGRMVPTYAGITTTLSQNVVNATIDEVAFAGANTLDIQIGDYFMIDNEIVRIKQTTACAAAPLVQSNNIKVFRGVLGTKPKAHDLGTVARRISVNPIELRRHSIIRASGHTFEYVGFGPGNYSTAFPDKQDRNLSLKEELLAQSTKRSGGVNFYTGMNDKGVSFNGNKKISAFTGEEEIIDTPIQTVTGEDIGDLPDLNVTNATEASIARSIKVEGGPDNKVTSEFNGPIILNNKLTSISDKGIEAQTLYIQGDQTISRKHTLTGTTPILSGNPGDILYYSDPVDGGHVGWVYSVDNDWRRFGNVSLSKVNDIYTYDQVGIGTTSPGTNTLQVGSGTTLVSVNNIGINVGSALTITAGGDVKFDGKVYDNNGLYGTAGQVFQATGAGVSWVSSGVVQGWQRTHANNGIYNAALDFVGIGTTTPRVNLEVGSIGFAGTSLYVNGEANFVGVITANNVFVSGILTARSVDIQDSGGDITTGIITATNIKVGTGLTTLQSTSHGIGIGTASARAILDIEGHTLFKTYSESKGTLSVVGGDVAVDLSEAQTFTFTPTAPVNAFRLNNIPDGSSSFTIKVMQGSSFFTVGINSMHVGAGATCDMKWPGGVIPVVTQNANAIDIYSFKIFDGAALKANPTDNTIFGVVGGQNYS